VFLFVFHCDYGYCILDLSYESVSKMITSVPNFNFLAPLVTEIWRVSQNNNWELLISSDAP